MDVFHLEETCIIRELRAFLRFFEAFFCPITSTHRLMRSICLFLTFAASQMHFNALTQLTILSQF